MKPKELREARKELNRFKPKNPVRTTDIVERFNAAYVALVDRINDNEAVIVEQAREIRRLKRGGKSG